MNKRGFTLAELLIVLVLLSLLMGVAIPGINKISTNMKKKSRNEKIELIEQSAILWGQDNKVLLRSSQCEVNNEKYYCYQIPISKLIDDDYLDSESTSKKEYMDPVSNKSIVYNCVNVYKKNNRVYANYTENTDCNLTQYVSEIKKYFNNNYYYLLSNFSNGLDVDYYYKLSDVIEKMSLSNDSELKALSDNVELYVKYNPNSRTVNLMKSIGENETVEDSIIVDSSDIDPTMKLNNNSLQSIPRTIRSQIKTIIFETGIVESDYSNPSNISGICGENSLFCNLGDNIVADENGNDIPQIEIYYWISKDKVLHIGTESNKIYAAENMSYFFNGFTALNKIINLNILDTSKVTDMSIMFYGCSSLIELDLSNFDTSKVTDMSGMFSDCSSLTKLDLSNFDTSKVTDMLEMFYDCSSLTKLDLSNFDTSKVTNMSGMFHRCSSLTKLDLSNFNTSKVTEMSEMFSSCSSLTELGLSNFDTSKVTDMSNMFSGCSSLSDLILSNFDTSKVTNMSGIFSGCSSLMELDLSNFDTSEVISMSGIFYNCSSLMELDLSNFDTSKVTEMSEMFSDCSSLTELDLSNFDTSKVTNMSGMFSGCSSLMDLNLSNFDTSKVTYMWNMFYGCSELSIISSNSFCNFLTNNKSNIGNDSTYCNFESID